MDCVAICGERVPRQVVAASHRLEQSSIRRKYGSKLRVSVGSRFGLSSGDGQVVNHPALVPAALVVNHKQIRDVGEHVDERARIAGICGQAWLWFQYYANGADVRQFAICTRDRQHGCFIEAGNSGSEDIGLKTLGVEHVDCIIDDRLHQQLEWVAGN